MPLRVLVAVVAVALVVGCSGDSPIPPATDSVTASPPDDDNSATPAPDRSGEAGADTIVDLGGGVSPRLWARLR